MRRASKVDANQAEIVKALRLAGAHVQSLAALGDGVPDILMLWKDKLTLLEIKDGKKSPSRRRLTEPQEAWHRDWPVTIVESVQDAIGLLE